MYHIVLTVEDDNHVVSSLEVLYQSKIKPTFLVLVEQLHAYGLPTVDTEALYAILEGDNVLIDTRDNCIQILEVTE